MSQPTAEQPRGISRADTWADLNVTAAGDTHPAARPPAAPSTRGACAARRGSSRKAKEREAPRRLVENPPHPVKDQTPGTDTGSVATRSGPSPPRWARPLRFFLPLSNCHQRVYVLFALYLSMPGDDGLAPSPKPRCKSQGHPHSVLGQHGVTD